MTIHPDGKISLQINENIPKLSMYKVTETAPLIILEPKFEPCAVRQFKGEKLPCGLLSLKWTCKLLKIRVGIKTCSNCTIRKEIT